MAIINASTPWPKADVVVGAAVVVDVADNVILVVDCVELLSETPVEVFPEELEDAFPELIVEVFSGTVVDVFPKIVFAFAVVEFPEILAVLLAVILVLEIEKLVVCTNKASDAIVDDESIAADSKETLEDFECCDVRACGADCSSAEVSGDSGASEKSRPSAAV
jgi:hypothetical protein